MSEGQPLSPAEMGIDEDELDIENDPANKPNPEQEQVMQPPATLDDGDSGGSEESNSEKSSGGSNIDQTKLSQSAGASSTSKPSRPSGASGEGLIKSGGELGKAMGDEVDILRPLE